LPFDRLRANGTNAEPSGFRGRREMALVLCRYCGRADYVRAHPCADPREKPKPDLHGNYQLWCEYCKKWFTVYYGPE